MTNNYDTMTDATGSVFEYHSEDPAIDCKGAWRFIGKLNGRTLKEFLVDLNEQSWEENNDCYVCREPSLRCCC